jgi:hypothetical protein
MTDFEQEQLEKAQAFLESRGWEVKRPPFDDPYEVMYRRMMREAAGEGKIHPADDPTSPEYEWGSWDTASLAFLKKHFVLKTESADGD